MLADAGWRLDHEHADGPDALQAALARRGWQAVLYGGDAGAVPARKALALVRLADPHLPFIAVSPYVRAGDLSALIRGLDASAVVVSDPSDLPRALTKQLEATRLRRRVGSAHHLLLAQQAITDHLAAGLEPERARRARAGHPRRDPRLGLRRHLAAPRRAGCSSARRPGTRPDARAEIVAFAEASQLHEYAPGQGMPGRVYAFRRPVVDPQRRRRGAQHARRRRRCARA